MEEYILKSDDFLVSQTDEKGVILFANDDFCKIAGYSLEELVGKAHKVVRHKDMPRAAFKDLWDTVKKGEICGVVMSKMARKMEAITGYMPPCILCTTQLEKQKHICLAEEKHLNKKLQMLKHYIKHLTRIF